MAKVKRIPNLLVGSEAISIEGGLLSPEWLSKIAQLQAEAQSGSDYGIPKGLTLRDEIGRYWRISEALWQEYQAKTAGLTDTTAQTEEFVSELFKQCLGFNDLNATEPVVISERNYPIRLGACNNKVPIVISSPQESLDKLSERFGEDHKRRTAFGLLQEYLNASESVLWGIVCDGESLRIVRDNSSLTKPAWISVELKRIFDEQIYADFAVFWLLCHRSRFGMPEESVTDCILEKWKEAGRAVGTRARDQLRIGVEEAIELLGQGFLANADNNELRSALQSGTLTTQHYFQELLRVVYRLIFLITIEERDLIHPEGTSEQVRNLYINGYGVKRLREKSIRRATYDRFSDLWESLKIVFKGLGQGEARLGLPALGGLFDSSQTPTLNKSRIDNGFFLQAVLKLYWLKIDTGVVRVNWRDMGPEELGSVYESLLELVPQVSDGGQRFSFLRGDDARGNSRKLTGSYYTPDDLVQSLLDSALEPVIANTIKNNPQNAVKALLNLTIIDPACGSAHFLLAAARRLAVHVARLEADGTPTSKEYRSSLRRVIGNCIYGVDRNPMALELARMSLWLEAMTPEAPLNFLDHHMVCGDALVGLLNLEVLNDGIPNEAFAAQSSDDKDVCRELLNENRKKLKDIARARELNSEDPQLFDLSKYNLVPILQSIEEMPDSTPQDVAMKQIALENYLSTSSNAGLTIAADMFLTAFFAPKNATTKNLIPTTNDLLRAVRGTLPRIEVINFIKKIVKRENILHWKLKFAHIFSRGGFDVVLGNPPWERVKLQEQEFFSSKHYEIASAANKSQRQLLINRLSESSPNSPEFQLYKEFLDAKRTAESTSVFLHLKSRYPLTGVGDVNTYASFAETATQLISNGGRVGFVVPSGIATDESTSKFFSFLSAGRLVKLIDFENRRGIFPGVHKSYKFCLLTIGSSASAKFSFFLDDPSQVSDKRRTFNLSFDELKLLNPNTKTSSVFRTQIDADLTLAAYKKLPVFWNENYENGNVWNSKFTRLFDMSLDSDLFADSETKHSLSKPVPLYEGKMIHLYDPRFASFERQIDSNGKIKIIARGVQPNEKISGTFKLNPQYWVEESVFEERLLNLGWKKKWMLGFRGVARSNDERSLIISFLPRVAAGNSLPLFIFPDDVEPKKVVVLVCWFSSLIADFIVRQKLGGANFNFFIFKQLPCLSPSMISQSMIDFVLPRFLSIAEGCPDLSELKSELSCVAIMGRTKIEYKAEIDAYFASLLGYSRGDLEYVLDPQSRYGADYPSETFRVLKENEISVSREYITQRFVLEAWDRLLAANLLPSRLENKWP